MALRVWLPLNGTLENKGISEITMSGTPASWGNGKIGKCATFTGNVGNVIYNNTTDYNYTDKFSWTIWINTNYTGTTTQYAFTNGRADAGGYGYGLQCSNTTTCNIRFGNQSFGVAVTGGEWTHLAFTKSGTSIKVYKNGSIVTDTTFTGTLPTYSDGNGLGLGCFHYSGNIYPFYGSLNDFRIYDHCLSQKEVKEISQGLILHYKLDGWSGGAGENLLANSMPLNSLSGWSSAGTNWSNSIVDCDITSSGKCVRCTYTGTTQVSGGIHHPPIDWNSMEDGEIYTLSAYLRASKSCTIIFKNEMMSSASSGTFTPTITQSWQKYEVSGPINKAAAYHSNVMYVVTSAAEQNMWIEACMVKLEKGSTSTAWALIPSEFGVNSTKITDSSGYGNNGTVTNTISTQQDSQRYEVSSYLNKKRISCSNGFLTTDDPAFTVSLWFKSYSNITYTAYADLISFTTESYSAQPFRLELCGSPVGRNLMWFRGPSGSTGGFAVGPYSSGWYTLDEWHHVALVSKGDKHYISYFDGKQTNTFDGSAYTWTPTGGVSIGDTAEGTASMNDFRIYATALSAEDILDLYHTSANIDDLYNIHSFEYNEIFTSNLYDFSAPWTYENLTGSTVDTDMGQAIKLVTSSTNQRAYKNVSNIWTTSGKQFVVSFIAKSDTEGITCDMSRSIADFTDKFTLSTKWKRYTGTITVTSTSTGGTLSFRINQSGATVYILDVKLEEANKNLISATKQGELLENNIDEIEYLTISKFKKESSNIIAKDFIEK